MSASACAGTLGEALRVELSGEQLELLAVLVAAKLQEAQGGHGSEAASAPGVLAPERVLVSASELARRLGVSTWWIYEHAEELGVVRLGDGKKARLRFDEQTARDALSRYGSERSQPRNINDGGGSRADAPRRARSLANRRPKSRAMLPARPRATRSSGEAAA